MRIAIVVALTATGLSTPALATSGYLCRPVSGAGPRLSVVIGSGAGPAVAAASLIEGNVTRSSMGERRRIAIAQSWLDGYRLWIDITDTDAMRYEARLRAQFTGTGRARRLTGTLVRGGRTYRIRCDEG
jgi:alkanesulfonate monooxygenase SsuD/methylene tetrahydromethanopterin reductase-like flavin-dependent oxidoreductase (luciferase family)